MALPESATRNWKTKALGSALLIGAVASAVIALLDDDPVTNPDWQAIIAAAAGVGIFVSRSESQHRKDKIVMLLAGLCLIPLLLTGCATPTAQNRVDANGVLGAGTPSNIAVMDNAGLQSGSYQGGLPTNIKQDSTGAWMTTPGQGGAVVLTLPNGISAYIWSPTDGSVASLTVTPEPPAGEPMLAMTGLQFNISAHAAIVAQMYADAMTALQGMTQIEATRRVQELQAAGTITATVAEALLKAFVPTLPQ
jgi:hypothetical protein